MCDELLLGSIIRAAKSAEQDLVDSACDVGYVR